MEEDQFPSWGRHGNEGSTKYVRMERMEYVRIGHFLVHGGFVQSARDDS